MFHRGLWNSGIFNWLKYFFVWNSIYTACGNSLFDRALDERHYQVCTPVPIRSFSQERKGFESVCEKRPFIALEQSTPRWKIGWKRLMNVINDSNNVSVTIIMAVGCVDWQKFDPVGKPRIIHIDSEEKTAFIRLVRYVGRKR